MPTLRAPRSVFAPPPPALRALPYGCCTIPYGCCALPPHSCSVCIALWMLCTAPPEAALPALPYGCRAFRPPPAALPALLYGCCALPPPGCPSLHAHTRISRPGKPHWLGLTAVVAVAVAPVAESPPHVVQPVGPRQRCRVPAACAKSSNMEEPLRRGRDGAAPRSILPLGLNCRQIGGLWGPPAATSLGDAGTPPLRFAKLTAANSAAPGWGGQVTKGRCHLVWCSLSDGAHMRLQTALSLPGQSERMQQRWEPLNCSSK